MKIIDGTAIAKQMLDELKIQVEESGLSPKLAVILVGDDPASKIYMKSKEAACSHIGIRYEKYLLPQSTQDELLNLIKELNESEVNAILLEMPLPRGIDGDAALEAIDPIKDVDGFHPINMGKLLIGDETIAPCTPLGVIELLRRSNIEIFGKHVVVVGRSNIVGKPMAAMLLNRDATVTVCHSKTKNLAKITKEADILIVAIGKPRFITAEMVKEGAVVIDVGINNPGGAVVGDVDFEKVKEKASAITPVPGGVGPMTVASLMKNTLSLAIAQSG
ncbi:MAG: bifunctional 5,10-methylenetetrahydrofolate dehydrogenase/5,10-methenyltetrahydrofolate cyclohydrolase [Candidatus Micrarchaeota archaeon]|nr:bifunctional 5,10-methylenetetrahydrofolate dehydrogenase/5,10-methenyltetrahydrofolate cyclohydrolase [Candidatus Micrarchaeota archaeon]